MNNPLMEGGHLNGAWQGTGPQAASNWPGPQETWGPTLLSSPENDVEVRGYGVYNGQDDPGIGDMHVDS